MKILALLFFLISFITYLYAPDKYSYQFCVMEMYTFIVFISLFLIHKTQNLGFFNFYTLFCVAFFLINYLHPVFIFPNDSFLGAYLFPYDENVICSGLSLAQLGISCFMFGSLFCENMRSNFCFSNPFINERRNGNILNLSLIMAVLLFLYVFLLLRASSLTHLYPRLIMIIVALLTYNFCLNFKYSKSLKNCILNNKKIVVSFLLFSFSLIVIGSRGPIIFLTLSVSTVLYLFFFRIRFWYIIFFLFSGLLFMTIITITRISSVNLLNSGFGDVMFYGLEYLKESDEAIWILFTDLVVNARNLYDAMIFPLHFDYLLGESYIQNLFVFIPFAGDFFTQLFVGVTAREVNTGYILTMWNNADYGLGTNLIGDLYMNFAEYGVIIGMTLLGVLVSKCEKCITINQTFIYIALVANSFYLPRASIFAWLDLWAFLWIIRFFSSIRLNKNTLKIMLLH